MTAVQTGTIQTSIPSRLDRLPWARFHWRIVIGLGTAWVLDGLEVTIVGAIAARLTQHGSGITITAAQIGTAASLYIVGACVGALFFGQLTDRYGRKKLFMITLSLYIVSTAVTALSFAPWFFYLFRVLTGAGIGGEYSAINSAIDELIPARARGRVDLSINGSYWIGSAAGSALALFFLDKAIFPTDIGWRLTFALGVILGFAVLLVRRHVPESPRWLFIHGREQEAESLVDGIEEEVHQETGQNLSQTTKTMTVRQRKVIGFRTIAKTAFEVYPERSILALALFVGQAFLYNGVTFNLGTLMSTFFGVAAGVVPLFTIVYALSNFAGPLSLGRLFDTVGRKPMIAGTYLGSAGLTVVLYFLFVQRGLLGPWSFIVVVMAVFFLASAGASAAYLTASEIFPMETRALAIAFFYAIGTAVGGITGPLLFGTLIASKSRGLVGVAFLIGALVMAVGGVVEMFFGVRAEGRQLEDIAKPLTAEDAEEQAVPRRHLGPTVTGNSHRQAGDEQLPAAEFPASSPRREASLARRRAEEQRAGAAEHWASAHEHLARAAEGGPGEDEMAALEDTLGHIAALRAQALDERATSHDQLALAQEESDPRRALAARQRAEAAGERALGFEQQAEALAAGDDAGRDRQTHLAEAAFERARAREQRALAELALTQGTDVADHRDDEVQPHAGGWHQKAPSDGHRPTATGVKPDQGAGKAGAGEGGGNSAEAGGRSRDIQRAKTDMHLAWADVHEQRAALHDRWAAKDQVGAAAAERLVTSAEDRAQAAAYRVEAAERRVDAQAEMQAMAGADKPQAGEHEERGNESAGLSAEEAARRQADEDLRAVLERRRQRQRTGLRRYRPGPGRLSYSPAIGGWPPERTFDNEIRSIERALEEHGPTGRDELAQMVGARYWGPGVFREALRTALDDGAVRQASRSTYVVGDGRGPQEVGRRAGDQGLAEDKGSTEDHG